MRWLLILAVLLVGCGKSPGEKAESDYNFIAAHGATPQEKCTAKRAVAEAWRQEQNAQKYDWAKLEADIACNAAQLDRT